MVAVPRPAPVRRLRSRPTTIFWRSPCSSSAEYHGFGSYISQSFPGFYRRDLAVVGYSEIVENCCSSGLADHRLWACQLFSALGLGLLWLCYFSTTRDWGSLPCNSSAPLVVNPTARFILESSALGRAEEFGTFDDFFVLLFFGAPAAMKNMTPKAGSERRHAKQHEQAQDLHLKDSHDDLPNHKALPQRRE